MQTGSATQAGIAPGLHMYACECVSMLQASTCNGLDDSMWLTLCGAWQVWLLPLLPSMCLNLVTTESLEKHDALSAVFLIRLVFIFFRHQLGEMAHHSQVAFAARWMELCAYKVFAGATHWCSNS